MLLLCQWPPRRWGDSLTDVLAFFILFPTLKRVYRSTKKSGLYTYNEDLSLNILYWDLKLLGGRTLRPSVLLSCGTRSTIRHREATDTEFHQIQVINSKEFQGNLILAHSWCISSKGLLSNMKSQHPCEVLFCCCYCQGIVGKLCKEENWHWDQGTALHVSSPSSPDKGCCGAERGPQVPQDFRTATGDGSKREVKTRGILYQPI